MKKYEQIYDDLTKKIKSGTYSVGNFIPTEQRLAEHYGASRGTVRTAIQMLEQEGLVQKVHGHGSRVLDPGRLQISSNVLTRFATISNRRSMQLTTTILSNKPSVLSPLDFGYNVAGSSPLILIERVRSLEGERIIFDRDLFFPEIVGGKLPSSCLDRSIYEYLRRDRHLTISHADKNVTIEPPSKDIRISLDLGSDSHVVVTRSLVYLVGDILFQIHSSFQRVDTFRLADTARYEEAQQ